MYFDRNQFLGSPSCNVHTAVCYSHSAICYSHSAYLLQMLRTRNFQICVLNWFHLMITIKFGMTSGQTHGHKWLQPLSLLTEHYIKSVRVRSYSGPYFPAFGLNTEGYFLRYCFLRSGSFILTLTSRINELPMVFDWWIFLLPWLVFIFHLISTENLFLILMIIFYT